MLTMQAGQYVRDLLNIEVVATLNMAFCELHHKKACSGENVRRECGKVRGNHSHSLAPCPRNVT